MDILLFTLNLQREKERRKDHKEKELNWNLVDSDQRLTVVTSPDSVTGATVPPSTLNLLESINATLLPPEAAARPVNVVDPWFGVYCKV